MKKYSLIIAVILISLIGSCVFAQKYMTLEDLRNMNKNKQPEKTEIKDKSADLEVPPPTGMTVTSDESETLAEGSYSKIEKPFIFIARTAEDYALLKDLVEGFSSDKVIDFKKQAVIAAFAGMKNTGGYSISIYNLQGRTNIITKSPPKDAFVTDAITYPYKIAVVPMQEEDSLEIAASDDFQSGMTTYKLTSGDFEFSGGFAGRQTTFQAVGDVKIMRFGDFVTFNFELTGKGDAKNRQLMETASAKISGNSGKIKRIEAGSFMDRPHPPLNVSVNLDGDKLSMKFTSDKRDYVISDGFEGNGSLEAVRKN